MLIKCLQELRGRGQISRGPMINFSTSVSVGLEDMIYSLHDTQTGLQPELLTSNLYPRQSDDAKLCRKLPLLARNLLKYSKDWFSSYRFNANWVIKPPQAKSG